jgi:hypothetical protein
MAALAVAAVAASVGAPSNEAPLASAAEPTSARPVAFEPNRGQTDARVRFLARTSGSTVYLTRDGAVFSLPSRSVRMRLLDSQGREPRGEARLRGRVNYVLGAEPDRRLTGIPTYAQVAYGDVYPGVDLTWHSRRGRLEYDFLVAPHADPGRVRLAFEGVEKLALDRKGNLVLGDELHQLRPFAFQQIDGRRRPVDARFVVDGARVRFALGAYDRGRTLVIDPQLVFSTYLGGNGDDGATDIKRDASGVYVAGDTRSTDFPTTPGSFEPRDRGAQDVFVTKFDPSGSTLVYSTYLGGSGDDFEPKLALAGEGSVYVAGGTASSDFPTTPGAFQREARGIDGFVTKLHSSGARLVYSTYLGGSGVDRADDLAVGAGGAVFVCGSTLSTDFPTTTGVFQHEDPDPGHLDDFVAKLLPNGSGLVYSTYVGGSDRDSIPRLERADGGAVVVTGNTLSGDFPTTPGAFQREDPDPGGIDVFVITLNSDASAPVYSTYLGGNDNEFPGDVVRAGGAAVYVVGNTGSTDFPTTAGAFQSSDPDPGNIDGFLTKLNGHGSAPVFSTYLGGHGVDGGTDLAVGPGGIALTGQTQSSDFPTTRNAFQRTDPDRNGFGTDAFVTMLAPSGSELVYSTYLGGGDFDTAWALALGGRGVFFVAGETRSTDFPTTPDAFQPTDPDPDPGIEGVDTFVTKLNPRARR